MSTYVRDVLRDNGLTLPAPVTGLVVDHILRVPARDPGIALPPGPRLLHISSCLPRKGVDLLLHAYDRLPEPPPLIIKSYPNPHNVLLRELHQRGYVRTATPAPGVAVHRRGPRWIHVIEAPLPLAAMRWLYEQCHLLVAPGRGEGFGLPLAEAMILGLPVVTTDRGGQRDFCTPETAWLVPGKYEPAQSHFHLPGSQWYAPDPEALRDVLGRALTDHPENRAERTRNARRQVLARYSAQAVCDSIHNALEAMAASRYRG
ncbi:glycosyltransferase family 4 protein [Ectothiorhodospira mobilis]|nr:glycosyltransferase family 4 protein [Ectothiorhodospira mobilis]